MADNAENIEVIVTVPEIETVEPVETPAPVVVVTPEVSDESAGVAVDVDHAERLVRLEIGQEAILAALQEIAAAQSAQAAVTEEVAAEVEEVREVVEEVAAEEQAEPDDDEVPEREHPFYRPRTLFGRK